MSDDRKRTKFKNKNKICLKQIRLSSKTGQLYGKIANELNKKENSQQFNLLKKCRQKRRKQKNQNERKMVI